ALPLARGGAPVGGVAAAVHDPLELGVPLVELVVTRRGGGQAQPVEQGDGRLVVVGGRDERGGADEVTGGDDEGVRVAQPLEVGGEVGGAPGVDGLSALVHDAAARAG